MYVGVTNIAYSPSGNGAAKVYLAKGRLNLFDVNYRDSEGDPDLGYSNNVQVNSATIEEGWVQMRADDVAPSRLSIRSIKYRLIPVRKF